VVALIPDGASIMIGGFMGGGGPLRLIDELVRQRKTSLAIVCNDSARPGVGIGKLIDAGLVRKLVTSHIGTNPLTQRKMLDGELEVELVPQGTLAERIRSGGFGLGGVLTPTGVGTLVAEARKSAAATREPAHPALTVRIDIGPLLDVVPKPGASKWRAATCH
jgi:acetate CoA/acetoacetate CoA-transferase alpha subunit